MNWFRRLFRGRVQDSASSPDTQIQIGNNYGHYDGSPLLVSASPNLDEIFTGDTPVIQRLSDRNRNYWSKASLGDRRMTALIGYLQHPDPEVRRSVMRFVPSNQSARVAQVLLDRLLYDPDRAVQAAAADTIWQCEKEYHCKFAVRRLNDIGDQNLAQNARNLLVQHSPDEQARQALNGVIKSKGED